MSQQARATYKVLWSNAAGTFADNSTRQISEGDMRNFADDSADSTVFKADDYDYYIKGTTASGTDTYTITDTIPAAYTSGERFLVTFTNANTGAATLNRNSLGAKNLYSQTGAPLTAGQIQAGGTYLVRYDGTQYRVLNLVDAGTSAADVESSWVEDFNSIFQYFGSSAFTNGGGAGAALTTSTFGVDSTEKASGVVVMGTSTSTAGGSSIQDNTYVFTFGFGFTYEMSMRIAFDALSDGTDTYHIRIGFMDAQQTQAAIVDGAYFRYSHGVNSGKWQAVTISNSSETAEDTGVAAEAAVYHVFKVVTNSDATQVDFYIDGVKTNDITTNIINSASRLTGKALVIEKTAGSTARSLYVDYISFAVTRTTAR
jgi:hypothetical protein